MVSSLSADRLIPEYIRSNSCFDPDSWQDGILSSLPAAGYRIITAEDLKANIQFLDQRRRDHANRINAYHRKEEVDLGELINNLRKDIRQLDAILRIAEADFMIYNHNVEIYEAAHIMRGDCVYFFNLVIDSLRKANTVIYSVKIDIP